MEIPYVSSLARESFPVLLVSPAKQTRHARMTAGGLVFYPAGYYSRSMTIAVAERTILWFPIAH